MIGSTKVPAVALRGLVKRYDDVIAVDGVDLVVEQGEVYGYLGPNGAGKTTSMRMILGLIRPDAGSVRLFGRDPATDAVAALDGVAGFVETPRFYPYLSGRRNLECFAALDGAGASERIDDALALVDLSGRSADRVGGYSFGMKQRLGIASALLRDPKLLILDEPTTGLDPAGQRDMRNLIRSLAQRGLTVLLSSHNLAEVGDLCTRVAIVRSGRIVYEGAIEELTRTAGHSFSLHTTDNEQAMTICVTLAGIIDVVRGVDGELVVRAENDDVIASVSVALAARGIGVRSLLPRNASLEELFFDLTARGASPERKGES